MVDTRVLNVVSERPSGADAPSTLFFLLFWATQQGQTHGSRPAPGRVSSLFFSFVGVLSSILEPIFRSCDPLFRSLSLGVRWEMSYPAFTLPARSYLPISGARVLGATIWRLPATLTLTGWTPGEGGNPSQLTPQGSQSSHASWI